MLEYDTKGAREIRMEVWNFTNHWVAAKLNKILNKSICDLLVVKVIWQYKLMWISGLDNLHHHIDIICIFKTDIDAGSLEENLWQT